MLIKMKILMFISKIITKKPVNNLPIANDNSCVITTTCIFEYSIDLSSIKCGFIADININGLNGTDVTYAVNIIANIHDCELFNSE